eukprot:1159437-Pelagomonas_calceolata.AAC.14
MTGKLACGGKKWIFKLAPDDQHSRIQTALESPSCCPVKSCQGAPGKPAGGAHTWRLVGRQMLRVTLLRPSYSFLSFFLLGIAAKYCQ